MSSRQPRKTPFLGDPSLYPEFALLVERQRLHHALRCGFHEHRTAALLALVAVSVAASGAKMPSCGCHGKWKAYLAKGLSIDLLSEHFEGIVSAIGCMLAITATSLLVYPLHRWACATSVHQANKESRLSSAAPNTAAITIAAAAPSIAVWAIAVCGAGCFRWGIASGLCVGLLCAGLTLKSVSFVQTCVPASETSTIVRAALGEANAVISVARKPGDATISTSSEVHPTGCETRGVVRGEGIYCGDGGGGGGVGPSGLQGGVPSLTFEEFVFFLLLAPSLVCQPRYLKPSARRPRSVTRAASEFFHASLTYLTVHVTCSTFFAPTLRVLAATFHSSWAATDGWAALKAEGSGGWLYDTAVSPAADFSGEVLAGQQGIVTVAAASFAGMVVLSPMMHFLMFYAFWHCVCLGSAELWGYPDRNIYGPWWLVMDDIRDYFRMWSAPVSRWLSSSVQRPVLAAGRRVAGRRRARKLASRREEKEQNGNQVRLQQRTSASTNGNSDSPAQNGREDTNIARSCSPDGVNGDAGAVDGSIRWWWLASVVCSFLASGVLHEAVAFIAMRRTFWPFNTLFLALSASMTPIWDMLFPVLLPPAGCASAGKVFEKVTEMKPATATKAEAATSKSGESCAVQNGGGAASTVRVQAEWSEPGLYPASKYASGAVTMVRPTFSKAESHREAKKENGNADAGRVGVSSPSIGRWRGWTAVVVYMVASVPLTLAVDYLVWQWWRAVMVE